MLQKTPICITAQSVRLRAVMLLQKTPRYASPATPRYASLRGVATLRSVAYRGVDINCAQMFDIFINSLTPKRSKSATPL
jgi:hypothetical protein